MKRKLKQLSKEFDLKYNKNWFNFIWISKSHAKYLEYFGMCFDPIYTKFGKTIEKRINHIEKFEKSKEFKKIKKEYGGQAITKKEVIEGIKNCKEIRKKELREELLNLHKKIYSNLKESSLIILTQTKNKKQKKELLNSILIHEGIHHLLIKNKIYFKSSSEALWKYDEGLVTYLEYYLKRRLSYLETIKKKTKYPNQKAYYIYAIKFRDWLKDIKEPKKRKQKLLQLVKNTQNEMSKL